MKYRKLRIAWSVAWGIACLLLVVLWIRSHWRVDGARGNWQSDHIYAATRPGAFQFAYMKIRSAATEVDWTTFSEPVPVGGLTTEVLSWPAAIPRRIPGLQWWITVGRWQFEIQFWLALSLAALMTPLPWLRWSNRFSLRTLLIAMTLVAAMLGLAVYTLRQ